MSLKGLSVIAVTPFLENGRIDYDSIETLLEFYIDKKVNGVTILGIMGEVNKLSEEERLSVMDTTIRYAKGRIPVIVGCTTESTDVSLALAKKAEEAGAYAVMIAPPRNMNNERLLKEHYAAIAKEITLPIVLQDEPVTTGVKLSPEFIAELTREIERIQYVKLEEAPTTIKISKILKLNPDLMIFGGLGGVYYFEELERGASGIMTGFAFPELLVNTYDLYVNQNPAEAREFFYKYLPLIRFEAQLGMGGVAIRKEIYRLRGAISKAAVRAPSVAIDQKTVEELQEMTEFLGLKF